MNEKTFKVLFEIYKSREPLYLREIVKKTRLPYGTVQNIVNRNIDLFNSKISGKNKYFSFADSIENRYLFKQIEIENTAQFIKKNLKLKPFLAGISQLKRPILIFGSYAQNKNTKNSDIDLLIISNKKIKLPLYLFKNKIHSIYISKKQINNFKKETLYTEIKNNHIIISYFDFFLKEVFE
ncbi:nucleotidyltransferase domain-containing protein [Candidatus Woesearchaeota archaeon]|nr:nucleotidyltransferase domain-containing protein [Candidatus Woesearchaeota archaeon]